MITCYPAVENGGLEIGTLYVADKVVPPAVIVDQNGTTWRRVIDLTNDKTHYVRSAAAEGTLVPH